MRRFFLALGLTSFGFYLWMLSRPYGSEWPETGWFAILDVVWGIAWLFCLILTWIHLIIGEEMLWKQRRYSRRHGLNFGLRFAVCASALSFGLAMYVLSPSVSPEELTKPRLIFAALMGGPALYIIFNMLWMEMKGRRKDAVG